MNIEEAKEKYNILLKRINKADEFFKTCTKEEVDKYLPSFMKIVNTVNIMIFEFRKNGIKMDDETILEGFK